MQKVSSMLNQYNKSVHSPVSRRRGVSFFKPVGNKQSYNEPNAIYEQEAETPTHTVMRMPASPGQPAFFEPVPVTAKQFSLQSSPASWPVSQSPIVQRVAYPADASTSRLPPYLQEAIRSSVEVPYLREQTVTAINAAMAQGDNNLVLKILLETLDPNKYYTGMLHDGKLHIGTGNSRTVRGPVFKEWLTAELSRMPAGNRKNKSAVKNFLKTLNVPPEKLDIIIEIAASEFENLPKLYTTLRHEWIHFNQIVRDPTSFFARNDFPEGDQFANPTSNRDLSLLELEAYLWEAEHMDMTGINNNGAEIFRIYNRLNIIFHNRDELKGNAGEKYNDRFKDAFKLTWELAFERLLHLLETIVNDTPETRLAGEKLRLLWKFGRKYAVDEKRFESRYRVIPNNAISNP